MRPPRGRARLRSSQTESAGLGAPLRVGLSAGLLDWRARECTKGMGRFYRCDAQKSIRSPPCSPQIQRARVLSHTHTAIHSRAGGLHTRACRHCSGGLTETPPPSPSTPGGKPGVSSPSPEQTGQRQRALTSWTQMHTQRPRWGGVGGGRPGSSLAQPSPCPSGLDSGAPGLLGRAAPGGIGGQASQGLQ